MDARNFTGRLEADAKFEDNMFVNLKAVDVLASVLIESVEKDQIRSIMKYKRKHPRT